MSLAPIIIFAYNRLDHLMAVIDHLKKNILAAKSDLIVYSDGSRNEIDAGLVSVVRSYLRSIVGFNSINIIEREKNYGLAKSIITGVSEVVAKYGKVIVLEDDLLVSPFFLQYMNDSLKIYENEKKVVSIHGYVFPMGGSLPETFFIKGADCWGWATWKRGWDTFEQDGDKLLHELIIKNKEKEFDFGNGYPFIQMLKMQARGLNNSWAIRWYASAFLKDLLTLYPGVSLVKNIGFDGSGSHSGFFKGFVGELKVDHPIEVSLLPCKESAITRSVIEAYYHKSTLRRKIKLMEFKNNFRLFLSNFIT